MANQTDQADLITRFTATRDPALREEIVMRFLPLVHYILGRMGLSQEMGMEYEDMVSQGVIGLLEAVDRYDLAFGTQFSTYASIKIRGKVLDYLRSLDWLSRTARQRSQAVQKAISALWEQEKEPPSDEDLAKHMGLDVGKVQQALVDSSRMIVSLDTIVDDDEHESMHEYLADEKQEDPSVVADEMDLKATLVKALKTLPEREQLVLSLYYYEELTFKEIGAVLKVSESRICQLHGRAMMSVKAMMAKTETL